MAKHEALVETSGYYSPRVGIVGKTNEKCRHSTIFHSTICRCFLFMSTDLACESCAAENY